MSRGDRTLGSTGGDWKQNAIASPRQPRPNHPHADSHQVFRHARTHVSYEIYSTVISNMASTI